VHSGVAPHIAGLNKPVGCRYARYTSAPAAMRRWWGGSLTICIKSLSCVRSKWRWPIWCCSKPGGLYVSSGGRPRYRPRISCGAFGAGLGSVWDLDTRGAAVSYLLDMGITLKQSHWRQYLSQRFKIGFSVSCALASCS
jgi:hypothetical protein